MRESNTNENPNNATRLQRHTHQQTSSPEGLDDLNEPNAQIIDFLRHLEKNTIESTPKVIDIDSIFKETALKIEQESAPPPRTLNEKRLDSIFAVIIGSVITAAILPMTSSINNPKIHEGANAGVLSFVGWGVFFASIPYLENSKLGRISLKKKQKPSN